MAVNEAKGRTHDDSWLGDDRHSEQREIIFEFWNNIPEANRAWLEVVGVVLFDDILDIDELGDEYVQAPHIYATFAAGRDGPFKRHFAQFETIGRWDGRSFHPREKSDAV